MATYSEWRISDGEFTGRRVIGDLLSLIDQALPDMKYAEGAWEPALYRVDPLTEQLIEPPAAAIAAFNARPRWPCEWDRQSGVWRDLRTLQMHRADRAMAIKGEALQRMSQQLPGLRDFESVMLMREMWLSIAPAARQPTARLAAVIAIFAAASSALQAVQAATTADAVAAVVVTWP